MRRSPLLNTALSIEEVILFEPTWTDMTMSGENFVDKPNFTDSGDPVIEGDVAIDLTNLDIYQVGTDEKWHRRRLSDFSPSDKKHLQEVDPPLFAEIIEKERG